MDTISTSKYKLHLKIKGLPLTANSMMRRQVIYLKRAEREKWTNAIHYLSLGKRPESALKRAKLKCFRHSSTCPDFDGLVSSFKMVLDALVTCKILVGDSMKIIDIPDYRWFKVPRNEGFIEIFVESVD